MRLVTWLGGLGWAGSWYLMYLEVTRWHHVKPSLAFNSELPSVGGMRPHPGLPLILLYVACVAAPLTVVVGLVMRYRAGRSEEAGRREEAG
ncbi:hypothetical protein [Actinophytocola sp.]|uniref:hypothetical protein n=1 Tax=Actinophytocola sp. TaxID=1872138 RepID=UPI002EDB6C7C